MNDSANESPNGAGSGSSRELAHAARRALGIDDLVLVVHDASFPSAPGEDVGRGSPYSRGARRLCEFADGLGFTGLQLGPQGVTTAANRSPYDGSVFSRSPLSISLDVLGRDPAWEGLLDGGTLDAITSRTPLGRARVHYAAADAAHERAMGLAFQRFAERGSPRLRARFRAFRHDAAVWLEHDVEFEARAVEAGSDDWSRWPPDLTPGPSALRSAEKYAFAQFVVHSQHEAFRVELRQLGWKLFGDLQIGLSPRDRWLREALFLDGYALGAPPSRTEPQGQPWGYGVLRPGSSDARSFFRARIRKMAREYDGVRIDHPHGLVCPWVYDRDAADPLRAVAGGARLFESPNVVEHRALAPYAIARADQIDDSVTRYADAWVRRLDPDQVEQYAERIAIVVDELAAVGSRDVACEVLSTAPVPLVEVLRRHGLGRFRVTQKADLSNPRDGYRSENAKPDDWIMVGTHDTPPLARIVAGWFAGGTAGRRAAYLAERLERREAERSHFAQALAANRGALTQAMFADLFSGPARHVVVFMSDLFGLDDVYNKPGIVSDDNWAMRVPNDFEETYARHVAAGTAMDAMGALAVALRRREDTAVSHAGLASALERCRAQRWVGAAPNEA